ncbi:MAG: phosphoribosyl-AMP cyclohydrolase [Bacillota bacterium]|nr:phosphoribosyl-AMP cyclohydrolase [Bacillota bacterium]
MDFNIFFRKSELVPVIVQDAGTKKILMLAYADREALRRTTETGYACFYSRSRKTPWMKGETSGNKIKVSKIISDCDDDTLLYLGVPSGPVCHTGNENCFFNVVWEEK